MRKLIAGVVCAAAILALAGCSTTYEENYPAHANDRPASYYADGNTCYVRDERGRRWQASGRNACHHALRKCREWHSSRGIENGRCWVGG